MGNAELLFDLDMVRDCHAASLNHVSPRCGTVRLSGAPRGANGAEPPPLHPKPRILTLVKVVTIRYFEFYILFKS